MYVLLKLDRKSDQEDFEYRFVEIRNIPDLPHKFLSTNHLTGLFNDKINNADAETLVTFQLYMRSKMEPFI